MARRVARLAARTALATLIAGAVVWWGVARAVGPGSAVSILVGLALLVAPAVLGAFALGCRALAALPGRLREMPGAARARAAEIRRRAAEVAEARRRGVFRQVPGVVRLGMAVTGTREILELSPALVLLSPWMLGATAVAALAAVVEILAGLVALVVLLA